ncbi:hypothetical protein [Streptomyces sp. NPDC058695]|uniref:hypothetical protein n=1 Tax=Streptomyces sp. NPDC058695 TaxID=3346604 RepID=UPI00365751E5
MTAFGPSPCMIGTASLVGYFVSSIAASTAALALVPLVRMPETAGRSLRADGPADGDRVAVETDVSVPV